MKYRWQVVRPDSVDITLNLGWGIRLENEAIGKSVAQCMSEDVAVAIVEWHNSQVE